jgi:cation diffusion facilitator CzcD-associated flavoprotein CzcO
VTFIRGARDGRKWKYGKMNINYSAEVVVVGGGPAGLASASALSSWSVVSSLYQKHSRKVGGFGNRFVCVDLGDIIWRLALDLPRRKSP